MGVSQMMTSYDSNADPILLKLSADITKARPTQFQPVSELLASNPRIDWLIHTRVENSTTGQLFGPSGDGKTFVALDMSLAVSTGGEWNGYKAKRGLVLYLAVEGKSGLSRRVKAWAQHHSITAEGLALFHISRNTISLSGDGLPAVIAEAQALSALHEVPVGLIVIDTLARHIDGDENSTRDMCAFVQAVDSLRDGLPGATAMIVHHTGHGEEVQGRGRGSSALKAAMDFEIQCTAGCLTFTKMKDSEEPDPIEFKLVPVQIGTDEDGEPLTSCIVAYGSRSEKQKIASLTGTEKEAIRVLVEVSAKFREETDGMTGALIGDWRDAFYQARKTVDPDAKTNTIKNAFLRAHASLLEKSVIREHGHGAF